MNGISALGARYTCTEQLKELASGLTRGSRIAARETSGLGRGWGYVCMRGFRRKLLGHTSTQHLFPTSGPSP